MARFMDMYLDPCIPGYPAYSSPRWSTDLVTVDNGGEVANQRWAHPMNTYTLPEGVRNMETFNALRDHWLIVRGPAHTWAWRDPLDCASVALSKPVTRDQDLPTVTMLDQVIGTGDGVLKSFQLTKLYSRGGQTYTRIIRLPVTASVKVSVNGVLQTSGYTVSRLGGVVTFTNPVPAGQLVRAGFLFDVEVRFESDEAFDGIVKTFGLSGFADLKFVETRSC